jgi:hypothetical protein
MLYLLITYLIFIVLFIVYSIMGVYHLWRFGYVGDLTKPVIIIYSVFTTTIIVVSLILILTRSWPASISLT